MHFLHLPTSKNYWRGKLFFAGVVMLLLSSVGNVYGHLCLDGQEPAVSVHLDNLKGVSELHADHEGDAQAHNDYEVALQSSALVLKIKPLQDFVQVLPVSILVQVIEYKPAFHTPDSSVPVWQAPATLYPPLRAPPVFS
jgi:hypothetical protein